MYFATIAKVDFDVSRKKGGRVYCLRFELLDYPMEIDVLKQGNKHAHELVGQVILLT